MPDFVVSVNADEKTGADSAAAVQGRIDWGRRSSCTGHQRLLESHGGGMSGARYLATFYVCCEESLPAAREAVIQESAHVAGGPFKPA